MGHPLPPELGPVVITAREVYDAVVRVSGQVALLDSKVTDIATDGRDFESRIRALEKNRWPLPALAVLVSIAAIIVSVLVAYHR